MLGNHIPFGAMLGEQAGCNIIETRPNVARYIYLPFSPGDISAETVIPKMVQRDLFKAFLPVAGCERGNQGRENFKLVGAAF